MLQGRTVTLRRVERVLNRLRNKAEVVAAYLFGSQVDDHPDEFSDIDIAVFVNDFRRWTFMRQVRVSCGIKEAEGDDLDLHFFDAAELPGPHPATFAGYVVHHGVPIRLPGKRSGAIGMQRTGAISR